MAFDASGDDRVDVVGESFRAADLMLAARSVPGGDVVREQLATLVPEPTNRHDPNAVKVLLGRHHVGYLGRELAALVADDIARLTAEHGTVTCLAEITGSGENALGFGVVLHLKLQNFGVYVTVDDGPADLDDALIIEPAGGAEGGEISSSPATPPAARPALTPEQVAASFGQAPEVAEERLAVVSRAVESWKSELIDLTGRNRLLFFRELPTGTLAFDGVQQTLIFDLLAGRTVALSKLISPKLPPKTAQSKLTPFDDGVRRLRAITRVARAYEEERGIRTLFLACGFVQWTTARATRPVTAPLLLVPVLARSRGASQQDFELEVLGEPEVNPTLLHLLRTDHRIELDEQELLSRDEMDGGIDTPEELAVAEQWITDACHDLPDFVVQRRFVLGNFWYAKLPMVRDLERSLSTLANHNIAAALAGHQGAKTALAATGDGPIAPAPPHLVLDSDSSQSRAIAQALAGRDLVIKGPPGTGKSQTISNLIASAIAQGERVLFVAEKRAAIDAVVKRLRHVGLGDLVLDLHSGAESKRWFAAQLGESLEAIRASRTVRIDGVRDRADRARATLDAHVGVLHDDLDPWEHSLFDAEIAALALGEPTVAARLGGAELERLTEADVDRAEDQLRDLASFGALRLDADGSPWRRARVTTTDEAGQVDAALDVVSGIDAAGWVRRLQSAADGTGHAAPITRADAAAFLERAAEADALLELLDPAIWARYLTADAPALAPLGRGGFARWWAGLTNGAFKAARAAVVPAWKGDGEPEPAALLAAIERAAALQSAWEPSRTPVVVPERERLGQEHERLVAAVGTLSALADPQLEGLPLAELADRLAALLRDRALVSLLPAIAERRAALVGGGFGGLVDELCAAPELPDVGVELRRVWARSLAEVIRRKPSHAAAAAFRGARHAEIADAFRAADAELIAGTAAWVRRRAAEEAVAAQDAHPEQATLVRGQATRKRAHLPIREVFAQAPEVVTALRPCWVMSPLMVSQLLPSDRAYFDLVVFDEASQVRPVEALSSMIRGRRLVVSGDERQLPPTSFFDQTSTSDDSGATAGEESTETQDYESILDVLRAMLPTEMLRWHYRSRDERLIAFSNHEIYGGGLTTFPGAIDGEVLSHVLVDELPAEDELSRVSPRAEVERVVELVLEHAATRPGESLGVIALGSVHADAIDARLLEVLRDRVDLDAFFSEEREERFFVKNLERVQGDERDAIILAVGYGRTPTGDLPHRFGPLNTEGGERRLNVAVSRAKRRMTVVSSFAPDAIDPKRSAALGVQLLKSFLAYAARGGAATELTDAAELATALHRRIAGALDAAGYEVSVAFGTSADRVDLAVHDPELGRVAVAVELDGPGYAARRDARDRDRLRPEQLRRLHWQVVHTWALDWLRDPEAAAAELVTDVEAALATARAVARGEAVASATGDVVAGGDGLAALGGAGSNSPLGGAAFDGSAVAPTAGLSGALASGPEDEAPFSTQPLSAQAAVSPPADPSSRQPVVHAVTRGPKPAFRSGGPAITDWHHADLVALARWIESDGSLLTAEELQREVMAELGITRRGSRVAAALDAVVRELRG